MPTAPLPPLDPALERALYLLSLDVREPAHRAGEH
jgi:hypothetical protein